jgi:hypothetical protein
MYCNNSCNNGNYKQGYLFNVHHLNAVAVGPSNKRTSPSYSSDDTFPLMQHYFMVAHPATLVDDQLQCHSTVQYSVASAQYSVSAEHDTCAVSSSHEHCML